MSVFSWYYSPVLLLGAFWLSSIGNAQAAEPDCKANVNSNGVIDLGKITPTNAKTASITANLNYTCTNREIGSRYISVCLAADSGDYNRPTFPPRYMKNTNDSSKELAFTMTLPGNELWGSRSVGGTEFNTGHRETSGGGTFSGSVPITVKLLPVNGNTFATPGEYVLNFDAGHTALTAEDRLLSTSSDCSGVSQQNQRFPFMVKATVASSCVITSTSDIDLGTYSANKTDIQGENSSAINVICTNQAPYTIGLSPSNNDLDGSGVMTSKNSNNTDKVPYQLRSQPGLNGTVWGNRTTIADIGNGVADTGTGTSQTKAVYVTVPSADYKPDEYSDTVFINVNY